MMKLTRYGKDVWLPTLLIALALDAVIYVAHSIFPDVLTGGITFALICVISIVWLALAAFFRDPARTIPADPTLVLSPADGTIRDIELIKNESVECAELRELFHGSDMLRIGIFLSVFSVHINRVPVPFKVAFKHYKKGAFHDARDGAAIKENESMILGGTSEIDGVEYPVAVKQVSGAIARRIVCPPEKGDFFAKGDQYGMIKFGSRTELYLPCKGFEVAVKIGDAVSGGTSVLARILPDAKEKLQQL